MIINDATVYLEEVGWDAGCNQNKLVCQKAMFSRDGARPQAFYTKLRYPSNVCVYDRSKALESVLQRKGISLEKLILSYQGTDYAVGQFAVIQSSGAEHPVLEPANLCAAEKIVQFLAGMAYIFPDSDEIQIGNLIVGLPLANYDLFQQEIEEFYQNREFAFAVLHTGRMKPIRLCVRNISCQVQGNGAFFDKFFEMNEYGDVLPSKDSFRMKHLRMAICDLGAQTVTNHLCEGPEPLNGSGCVFNYGITNLFKAVAEKLDNLPVQRLETAYLNYINPRIPAQAKRPELYWAQKTYPMEVIVALCDQEFTSLGRAIAGRLIEQWGEHLDRVERLILCGGGANAPACVAALKSQFKMAVEVTADPQFANVYGFLKAAKFEQAVVERFGNRKTS